MVFGLILFLMVFIIVILGMAYQEVSNWLYPDTHEFPPRSIQPLLTDITVQTEDGLMIAGWYVPPENGIAILMLHGHSGNRDQLLIHGEYLLPEGYGILSIDFRNHGDSDGDRT